MVIKIKDMVSKVIGIMMTMMYLVQGSVMTMQSTWNGPPGAMVRFMGNISI